MSYRGVNVLMAKTGVKYVHHAAKHFDVGIYFEANGHGTVLFSDRLIAEIKSWSFENNNNFISERKLLGRKRLQACLSIINSCIGDALSDLLLTLAILNLEFGSFTNNKNSALADWHAATYRDLPSRQNKVSKIILEFLFRNCLYAGYGKF